MYNNAPNRRVVKKVEKQTQDMIERLKVANPPIKGGNKDSKPIKIEDWTEVPNGTQLWGPNAGIPKGSGKSGGKNLMSGYGENYDFEGGYVKSKGATGSGKKMLWSEIDKAINQTGGYAEAIDRQIGGSVVESFGYETEPYNDFMEGGGLRNSKKVKKMVEKSAEMAPHIEKLAEKSELLIPVMQKAPEGKLERAKYIIKNVAEIAKDIAPLVKMAMDLKREYDRPRGGAKFPEPTQLLTGNFTGGKKKVHKYIKEKKPKVKGPKSEWNNFVKDMMKKRGGTMKDTLKHIKENNLWKKK